MGESRDDAYEQDGRRLDHLLDGRVWFCYIERCVQVSSLHDQKRGFIKFLVMQHRFEYHATKKEPRLLRTPPWKVR